jgi:hypothetical protein
MPIPTAPLQRSTVELLARAFVYKARRPEIYRARCWRVYASNGTLTVIPEVLLIQSNACFMDFPLGEGNPSDITNPHNGRIQIALDELEKITNCQSICTMFEVVDFRWVGRCSAHWQNFTDETDWHEADSEDAIAWELIDAYGDLNSVEDARPQMFAG